MNDGEPGDFFCFLADGELNVSKGGKMLNLLTNGDCFGEMAVINQRHGQTRGANVTALTRADIITVRGEALEQASVACRMHFYQSFLEVLSTRLAFANQRMATY
jgi:CRP-like cAMP-binding protein